MTLKKGSPKRNLFFCNFRKNYQLDMAFFITPHKIVPGGIYGLGIIVYYLTKGMALWPDGFPIGIFNLLVNIPLTYIGIKMLGPRFGVKTIYGFVSSSIFMDGITWMREIGDAPLVNDVLLSCIFGGVL